jgi:hypothetical protein
MKDFAENVCMTDVGFSGVGLKGTAKETGTLRMKVGEEWLDNQLNCVNLERGEGKFGRHYFSFHMQEDKKEEDLKALLEKYSKLFAGDERYFPLSKLPPVKIELLPDARPVKVLPHHKSPENEQMFEEEIGEMAAKALLNRIRDPKWVFPFFVAKGKGRGKGKKRTAVDFRRLNYPMPSMDDLIDSIPKGSLCIFTIDGAKAYLQQGVEDPEKCLTIRGPRSGCWHFKGLPLGVSAAVALFQRQMEAILREDFIAAGVRVYLDDIIVFSRTRQGHLTCLTRFLKECWLQA